MNTFEMIKRQAVIVQHCAVMGTLVTKVRAFRIGKPSSYAQYANSVTIGFWRPRKRREASYRIVQDDSRYLTIEADGVTLYDSRKDVPCDMEKWRETDERFQNRRGFSQET